MKNPTPTRGFNITGTRPALHEEEMIRQSQKYVLKHRRLVATSDGLNCWDVKPGVEGQGPGTQRGTHVCHSVINRRVLAGGSALGLLNLVSISSWMALGSGFYPLGFSFLPDMRLD